MIIVSQSNLSDAPTVTNVIAEAFSTDPTWTWAFPNLSARKTFWALQVKNALRYPYVLKTKKLKQFLSGYHQMAPNCRLKMKKNYLKY